MSCTGPPSSGGRFESSDEAALERLASELHLPPGVALLQAVEAATPAGLAVIQPSGRLAYVNPALCAMVGRSRDELVGAMPPYPYWPVDDLASHESAVAATLRGEVPPSGVELNFQHASGRRFPAHLLVSPLKDQNGDVVAQLVSIHDLSDRQRAEEERLRRVREQAGRSAAEGAARHYRFLAHAGEVLSSSLELPTILSSVAELAVPFLADRAAVDRVDVTGTRRIAFVGPSGEVPSSSQDDLPFDAGSRALRSGRSVLTPSLIAVPLVGHGRPAAVFQFAAASGRHYGPDDLQLAEELVRRAGLAADNARLLADAQALRREAETARGEAERASRAKDELLAMLGHELRNPLAPIMTAVELMRMREGADGLLARERAVIERQVSHLVRLVDDLLDISRITRGGLELKRRPLEVADVVARAIEAVSPLLEQRMHRLAVDIPSHGLVVSGDEERLVQVLSHLLSNAAKYTPPGGRVDVSAEHEDRMAVIRVRDTGIGIDPVLLPHVFDLFTQSHRSLDRSEGGLGLGLAVVRNVAELHGGSVSSASGGPGQGSEFTVRLPLDADAARAPGDSRRAAVPTRVRREADIDDTDSHPATGRVLVVDDNRDAAETLAEALASRGFDARTAFDGPSALALATSFTPDVALLDIGLPVMDGYELGRRLREMPGLSAVELVAVTGYGQDSDRQRSAAVGFREHLVKPVDLRRVTSLVSRLVTSH